MDPLWGYLCPGRLKQQCLISEITFLETRTKDSNAHERRVNGETSVGDPLENVTFSIHIFAIGALFCITTPCYPCFGALLC